MSAGGASVFGRARAALRERLPTLALLLGKKFPAVKRM